MNSLVIGGILKRIYKSFDMSSFSNRLKLQKIVYLLQQSDINLGYTFAWYLYGPYSVDLMRDGFNLANFNRIAPVGFSEKTIENKFEEFLKKIEPHKNSDFWLEIATSIHALKSLYPDKTKNELIKLIQNKRPEFNSKEDEIQDVWNSIEGWLI